MAKFTGRKCLTKHLTSKPKKMVKKGTISEIKDIPSPDNHPKFMALIPEQEQHLITKIRANGTGTYQPLDRTIFDLGNIKRAEIFGVIHQRMIKA